ncbi:MAG: CPBP family intramembrane metalloprotease, partial [Actinobacteria bacterium]|nr:CPBP family intramembrane metalloprotease [Actinomycetota bacterium]
LGVGIALILLNVATVGVALLLANRYGKPSAADFGLRRPRLGRAVGLLLAVGIGFTVASVLWVSALGLDAEEAQALTDRLGTDRTLTIVILIVVLTILAPLQEEFLFRGYIFRALRNRQRVWPAATTTGVLFAATHIGWIPIAFMVPIVLSGIGLSLLYHWTESLYPGIALHALNNSIPLAAALHWTWQTPLLMVGSTLAALAIARLIALRLGDRQSDQAASTAL